MYRVIFTVFFRRKKRRRRRRRKKRRRRGIFTVFFNLQTVDRSITERNFSDKTGSSLNLDASSLLSDGADGGGGGGGVGVGGVGGVGYMMQ